MQKKKSTTRGEKTGAAQEMKEKEICKRVSARGLSHCFRLESWPKWSCETERERRYRDTCQPPWDVRCEREKQSEGGWERGESERRGEGRREGGREAERMKTNSEHFDKGGRQPSDPVCPLLQTSASRWDENWVFPTWDDAFNYPRLAPPLSAVRWDIWPVIHQTGPRPRPEDSDLPRPRMVYWHVRCTCALQPPPLWTPKCHTET